ncbi:MAG: hypothetical protein K6G61_11515 [Solobacterium sp.]|nr:hypothetical protein [Solobacterium sp.]
MKKYLITVLSILLCACASESPAEPSVTEEPAGEQTAEPAPISTDAYELYESCASNSTVPDSYTEAVSSRYDFIFSDDTSDIYMLDGTVEKQGDTAHLNQYLNANGMSAHLEGYYYDNRLYVLYNGIGYYEDMGMKDVLNIMTVPDQPVHPDMEDIVSLEAEENGEEKTFTIICTDAEASGLFTKKYDIRELNKFDDFKILSHSIRETYDADNVLVRQTVSYDTEIAYSTEKIRVTFASSISRTNTGDTEVVITDAMKAEQAAYPAFTDIDTDAIETVTEDDDSPEKTASATFRKRLVSRLHYEEVSDGVYRTEFNDHETYTVNFNTQAFTYTNYSISYSYSWKGDTGSMGSCTYLFEEEKQSSDCEESVLEGIKNTKSNLQMELYYCGLLLEDLQNE